MKIFVKLLLIILFFCSLSYCTKKDTKNLSPKISIDFKAKSDTILLSKIADSISYINFKTPPDVLIGDISEIKYSNSKYYIYDKVTYSIFIFNYDGKFIRKINNHGRGPNEYTSIVSFDVHPASGAIYIYDGGMKQILVYNLEGELIKKVYVEDLIRDFAVLSNGDFLFYTPDFMRGNRRGLWKVDSNGKFKETLIVIEDDFLYGMAVPNGYFCRINKDVIGLIGNENKNQIYNITNNEIKTVYHFEVSIKIPDELRVKETVKINKSKYLGQFYIKPLYIESERWLLTLFTNFKKGVISLYDKKQKQQYYVSDFKNDIDGVNGDPLSNVSISNSIVSKISAFKKESNLKLSSLNEKISNVDNVIQFIHLKK